MYAALDHLQQSLNRLQVAVPNKDGHRASAINLIQQAINEVSLGIQAGAQQNRPSASRRRSAIH